MNRRPLSASTLIAAAALAFSVSASGQGNPPTYTQIGSISVPGGLASFDISWFDAGTERFYLADRTAKKGGGRIDVVDTQAGKLLYTIPTNSHELGFVGTVPTTTPGCSVSGPNGVVAVPQMNQLYVGDGDSNVKVVDLGAKAIVAVIPTGGKCRADEIGYDPLDHIIMIANPNDVPPFITFISTDTQSVVGTYVYQGRVGGLEQPVWDRLTKRFYITVPATASTNGSIDVFNPTTFLMEQSFAISGCSPAGNVLTASQKLVTSCGAVVDARTGNALTTVNNVGGDEIWYNPGENRIYFGNLGGTMAVVDADSTQVISQVPVAGRNLAVDSENGHVFVPVTGQEILIFAAQ